ncbi:putative signal peptide peptidase [Trypanosoma cruzi]|uniref:Signal peptide peptidase, putative n=2 Tax=Trypanosoma cruzi TaxID=5693 RepID=Q4DUR7_TRYCC|nr:signal peptide peptidase, putative [Trypanosoma cruzi]EAN96276.1 signal peptide peptidase, putative [Trypanosoma cruzi]PWV12882.1 putative signal peptide peptidase [Trypanosoma cruzi]|eukprot:XP_818127.1 signal peptide peptidase [Trypanosoma cruzi strain CL Brener]
METKDEFSVKAQLYLALGSLLSGAVLVVYLGSRRLLQQTLEKREKQHRFEEVLNTDDTLALPLMGSVVLFVAYVLLRFIPLEYFNALISVYLSIIGVFSLGAFLKTYINPNFFTGIICCAVGGVYYMKNSWIANNILAIAIAVRAIGSVHLGSFQSSFVMLLGLFLYDVFWVFGSDVMLTVASGINGPIKIVFPRTIFGDHQAVSLLGLGDLIIPGFFVAQTLLFSVEYVKRSTFYFEIALVAYTLSLVNTMAVMLIFEHGQPALLFIVPWLLVTFLVSAAVKGDLKAVFDYNSDAVTLPLMDSTEEKKDDTLSERETDGIENEDSLVAVLRGEILTLFGFEYMNEKADQSQRGNAKEKTKKE